MTWLVKIGLLGLALSAPTLTSASLYPSYIRSHYPATVQPLMLRENSLDEACRAGGDPASMQACNLRQVALRRLQDAGWCWGGADIEMNKRYVRCRPGDRNYDAGAFNKPYFSAAEIESARAAATPFQRADTDLNTAYSRLKAHYSAEGRAALRDAQRGWLASRNRRCGFETQNVCALRLTERRTAELNDQFSQVERRQ